MAKHIETAKPAPKLASGLSNLPSQASVRAIGSKLKSLMATAYSSFKPTA